MSDLALQPILALLGYPVAANPTQYMIEKVFAQHQADFRFLTLEVKPDDLGDALRGMRAMGFAGGMCADPHKQAVVAELPRNSEAATLCGVVNCLYREDEQLVGDNTEGRAMLRAVEKFLDPAGKNVVVLGAGKTARAVAVELALAKAARITIVNRGQPAGADLAGLIAGRLQVSAAYVPWEGEYVVPDDTHVLIHATSIGHEKPAARVPLDVSSLRKELVVGDVILDPPRTRLMADARAAGCPTIDGLDLFVGQAALAVARWTGIEPDLGVMREAVEEFLLL